MCLASEGGAESRRDDASPLRTATHAPTDMEVPQLVGAQSARSQCDATPIDCVVCLTKVV
eukprot:gene4867-biopygen6558